MRRVISAVVVAAGLALMGVAPSLAADGAFARDDTTGKYGFSWNEPSQKAAEDAAIKGCASPDCKVVFRVGKRQCGAVAMTEDGKVWGGAVRDKREAAQLASIENCQKRTGAQCRVKGSECNR